MLAGARALMQEQHRSSAVMRTRAGIIALDLAGTSDGPQSRALRAALTVTAAGDAYAARDMLAHHQVRQHLTAAQCRGLHNLVRACGLGAGTIPELLRGQLMAAAGCAESTLRRELEQQGLGPAT